MSENTSLSKHKGSAMGYALLFLLNAQNEKFHLDLFKWSQGWAKKGHMLDLLPYLMLLKKVPG